MTLRVWFLGRFTALNGMNERISLLDFKVTVVSTGGTRCVITRGWHGEVSPIRAFSLRPRALYQESLV